MSPGRARIDLSLTVIHLKDPRGCEYGMIRCTLELGCVTLRNLAVMTRIQSSPLGLCATWCKSWKLLKLSARSARTQGPQANVIGCRGAGCGLSRQRSSVGTDLSSVSLRCKCWCNLRLRNQYVELRLPPTTSWSAPRQYFASDGDYVTKTPRYCPSGGSELRPGHMTVFFHG